MDEKGPEDINWEIVESNFYVEKAEECFRKAKFITAKKWAWLVTGSALAGAASYLAVDGVIDHQPSHVVAGLGCAILACFDAKKINLTMEEWKGVHGEGIAYLRSAGAALSGGEDEIET